MENEMDLKTPGTAREATLPVDEKRLREFTKVLRQYHSELAPTKNRIIASENWWKLRNTVEEQKQTNVGKDGGFTAQTSWLHSVIVSKHADAMDAFPEPNILPREEGDKQEAHTLSAIIPCILQRNGFEQVYSDATWQKLKTGTGVYKVFWDKTMLNGLGDIRVENVNLLNLYWEPGVKDIQQSRYLFHTELEYKELLRQQYPKLEGRLKGSTFLSARFLYDDAVPTSDKATVIDVYYHKWVNGKKTLQYCKYVEDVVLYATENDTQQEADEITGETKPSAAERGLYDHGEYPYVFDQLFPIEGSPCGYGFVDIERNPQTVVDILKTSFVKNAMAGSVPRYFARQDGAVNEEEFLDLSNPLVHVNGNVSDDYLKVISHNYLDSNYVQLLQLSIQELRETSGNTETSTGTTGSGVTAASAIAALQEASGKGSRDSTMASYRSFEKIVYMNIELIRQFYDAPRSFRITGQYGEETFAVYQNAGLQPQSQGTDFGIDMGYRLPVFDIKVSAQKKSVYTKISQNELATQFFQMGFFNPQMVDQALMCLEMMDFDGKDEIMQRVAKNGTMAQKLMQYMQLCLAMATLTRPDLVPQIQQDMAAAMGASAGAGMAGGPQAFTADHIQGLQQPEHGVVSNAREKSQEASQPDGGRVISKKEE